MRIVTAGRYCAAVRQIKSQIFAAVLGTIEHGGKKTFQFNSRRLLLSNNNVYSIEVLFDILPIVLKFFPIRKKGTMAQSTVSC